MFKKIFCCLLAAYMVVSLCGCAFLPFDLQDILDGGIKGDGIGISVKQKDMGESFDDLKDWIMENGEKTENFYTVRYLIDESDADNYSLFCLAYDKEEKNILCSNMDYYDGELSFSDAILLEKDETDVAFVSAMYDDYYNDGIVYSYAGEFDIEEFNFDTLLKYDDFECNNEYIEADRSALSTSIRLVVYNLEDALEGELEGDDADYGKAPVNIEDLGFKSW